MFSSLFDLLSEKEEVNRSFLSWQVFTSWFFTEVSSNRCVRKSDSSGSTKNIAVICLSLFHFQSKWHQKKKKILFGFSTLHIAGGVWRTFPVVYKKEISICLLQLSPHHSSTSFQSCRFWNSHKNLQRKTNLLPLTLNVLSNIINTIFGSAFPQNDVCQTSLRLFRIVFLSVIGRNRWRFSHTENLSVFTSWITTEYQILKFRFFLLGWVT